MEEKLSNFIYLKGTELEKIYGKIVKAEYTCDEFPDICKITIRIALEEFVRTIAYKYNVSLEDETGRILKNIKKNIPAEIYSSLQIIRMNGIGMTLYRNDDDYRDKQPLELLNISHRIFCWYLSLSNDGAYNIPFKAPNKIEFDEHELKKIKDDINLKESQISNLRQKILDLYNESKSVSELNKIVIAIKEEKNNQEKVLREIKEYINIHKRIMHEVECEKESLIKTFNELKISCKSAHEDLVHKESQIVRAELDYQKIKNIFSNLDENNSLLQEKIISIEKLLDLLRDKYEVILELTNRRQDVLESIEFTQDLRLKSLFNHKMLILDNDLNNEDKYFNQYLSSYMNKVEEIESKIKVFKEILNDKIKLELRNKELYKSFLNLKEIDLRVIYSFIKNSSNYNIINKSRDFLSRYNILKDSFRDELNKSLENLKDINDNQIKIALYYELLKLGNIKAQPIYKRTEFINQFDKIINSVYNILMSKKGFNFYKDKITSIKIFYLKKFILELDKKHKVQLLDEVLTKKIYSCVLELNDKQGISIPEKYDLNNLTTEEMKNNIRKKPFESLYMISDFIDSYEIIKIYDLILEILKHFNEENIFGGFDIHISLDKFLKGPYRIYTFINNDSTILKNPEEILSIIVSEILVGNLNNNEDDDINYLEKYDELVVIWRKSQQVYSDLYIKRQKFISDISKIGIEKVELEIKLKNLIQHRNDLKYASEKMNNEFIDKVLNSQYVVNLPSYYKYKEMLEKTKQYDNKESKNTFSLVNIMEKFNQKINSFTSEEIKRTLISEGKQSVYFSSEYKEVESIEKNIISLDNDIKNNKKYIKEKDKDIDELEAKKVLVEKKMISLKKIYLDMHEE